VDNMGKKEEKEQIEETVEIIENKSPIEKFIEIREDQPGIQQEILNVLLEGDINLDLKTHILKPKQLAALSIFAMVLESSDFPLSAQLINNFIDQYLRNMVSYKRMSRAEIIRALTTMVQEDKTTEGLKKLITDIK
jgi:hypothetical protein